MTLTPLEQLNRLDELVTTTSYEGTNYLLLSEVATRELSLAIQENLNKLAHSPQKQEDLAHVHEELMDNFGFNRGSYVELEPLVQRTTLDHYTPDHTSAWEAVLETVRATTTTDS